MVIFHSYERPGNKVRWRGWNPRSDPRLSASMRGSLLPALLQLRASSESNPSPLAIPYIINSLMIMVSPRQPCLFLRILSLFVANNLKCLSINDLYKAMGFSNQGQSRLIVSNQGVFLEPEHLPIQHSNTLPFHSCIRFSRP